MQIVLVRHAAVEADPAVLPSLWQLSDEGRAGARALGNERLSGAALFVSLEPCAMCAGAIAMARVARLVFAACDPKGGAVLHGPRFFDQPTCHHRPFVEQAEPHATEAGEVLRAFFRARRG